jgi:Fe-Mn family superoxide dismutase
MYSNHYPFAVQPLPYSENALEVAIDATTLRIHHDRHLKTYVDDLNAALAAHPEFHTWSLEQLITQNGNLPTEIQMAVWNNAGGVYNHNLQFSLLDPAPCQPSAELNGVIIHAFGSLEGFKTAFKTTALSVFGSGYAWLVMDHNRPVIVKTANQDTPLPSGFKPLLLVDVWEHAYYLKYQNMRAAYLDSIWKVVSWKKVEELYQAARQEAAVFAK